MEIFVPYLIKSIFISAVLYTYYLIALRDKKFHSYNRFYLLLAIGASMILPLIHFKWYPIKESTGSSLNNILNTINTSGAKEQPFYANSGSLLLSLCTLISTVLSLILLSRIAWIYKIKAKYRNIKMRGFAFIETDLEQAPFSFLDNLFWKQGIGLGTVNGKKIFRHELAHIKQHHTYDKLFSQIAVCIFWMNPFYWFIQKELDVVHEFMADAASIGEGDTGSLAEMLLQAHNNGRHLDPYHPFFHSSIKRRLIMITTSKNTQYSYLRRVLVLPVLSLVCMCFSCFIAKAQNDPKLRPGPVDIQKVAIIKKPVPRKSNDSLVDARIGYLKEDGIAGDVDMAVKYSVAKINNDPGKEQRAVIYDEESGIKREATEEEVKSIVEAVIQNPSKDFLYYVDGKESSPESVKKLAPGSIKTINFFKNEDAVKKYGGKARNGVIALTVK